MTGEQPSSPFATPPAPGDGERGDLTAASASVGREPVRDPGYVETPAEPLVTPPVTPLVESPAEAVVPANHVDRPHVGIEAAAADEDDTDDAEGLDLPDESAAEAGDTLLSPAERAQRKAEKAEAKARKARARAERAIARAQEAEALARIHVAEAASSEAASSAAPTPAAEPLPVPAEATTTVEAPVVAAGPTSVAVPVTVPVAGPPEDAPGAETEATLPAESRMRRLRRTRGSHTAAATAAPAALDAAATTETDTAVGRGRGRIRFEPLTAAAGALVLAAAAFAAWSGVSWAGGHGSGGTSIAQARDGATIAARQDLTILNTLDYRTLDTSVAAWKAASTGQLESGFATITASDRAQIAAAKAVTTATVLAAAPLSVDAGAGKATVIASLVVVQSPPGGKPSTKRERFSLAMMRVGGVWKVSGLNVVDFGT